MADAIDTIVQTVLIWASFLIGWALSQWSNRKEKNGRKKSE
jgi:hypothetical protein